MKLLPLLALNAALVATALVAYDVLRTPPEPMTAPEDSSAETADALADRIAALESADRRPRRAAGVDPLVLERIAALEAAVAERAAVEPDDAPPSRPRVVPAKAPVADSDAPTADEIARFRRLQAAVRRADTIAKTAPRIDKLLDGLPLNLTGAERSAVHAAYADFQPRVDAIWGEVKAAAAETMDAGGQVDRARLVTDTYARIQTEFAGALGDVATSGDRRVIAEALFSGRK